MTALESQTESPAPEGFRIVEVTREPIELYKILKFEGLVSSGGEAKTAVASGAVRVNGKAETQKRKKIVAGDMIEFNDEKICIKRSSSSLTQAVSNELKEQGTGKE